MSVLQKIKNYQLSSDQYVRADTTKNQIYLHHTAGHPNPFNVIDYWQGNKERIGTSFVIAGKPSVATAPWKDGEIYQCFSTRFWAFHLGVKGYSNLDKHSIGFEICNFGPLTLKDGRFVNYVGGIMKESEVIELAVPYRGFKFYHSYTDAQIESTRELLLFLCNKWNIDKEFNSDIFDVSSKALYGVNGIWSHTSVRADKTDVYPHPKLISMLKSL